jgi:hypothetical protein
MDRLRSLGNEPGVQEMEISQAGSSQQKKYCASPMLLRTSLGSNSLTGSPKQAPMGKRPTLTVAVPNFLVHSMAWTGPPKFLTVIGLAAGQLGILLGQGGVDATSNKCREASFEGADGVVGSTTDYSVV